MSSVWGATNAKVLKAAEKIIRALCRLVLGIRKFDRVADAIADELKWLFPKKLCAYRSLCIFYKVVNANLVPYFSDCFKLSSNTHSYSMRNSGDY